MSINVDEFTVPEKILVAAEALDKQGLSPFSAETLIVESWKKFKGTFGLKGYAEKHPDSNKVLSSIMGEKGLVRRGWLVKMGQKLYALTRDGRTVVRRIMLEEDDALPPPSMVKLTREQDKFLQHLFESSAYQKFEQSRKGELTFADACRFWDISENTRGDSLDERMSRFHSLLGELDRVLADADTRLSSDLHVDAGSVRELTNIHRYMEDRFDRHLNLLRTRASRK